MPNDDTTPKKTVKIPSSNLTEDEDVIHFDLTAESEETPELHVNLSDEESGDDELRSKVSKDDDFGVVMEKEDNASFSLAGDDLMSLFEKLQQTIDEETQNYIKRQKQHRANITAEEEAMKKEKMEFEQKKKKMLDGLESMQTKLAGPVRVTK
jgi:hypothetical protein